jgi:uncharacterized protein YfdQ (DUF2303 family)
MSDQDENYARTIARLSAAAQPVQRLHQDLTGAVPALLAHEDLQLLELEKLLPAPVRIRAREVFSAPASLARYMAEHLDPRRLPAVLINHDKATIMARMDPHQRGSASWQDHEAMYQARKTPQWSAWRAADGKMVKHREFVDWLEDRLPDIAEPLAADLMDMMRTVRIVKDGSFDSAISSNGMDHTVKISQDERARAGGDVEIPSRLTLGVAVFEGIPAVRVQARLKVLPDGDGNLRMGIVLRDVAQVERDCFALAVAEWREALGTLAPGEAGTMPVYEVAH